MANNDIFTAEEQAKIDDAHSIVLAKIFDGLENEKEDSTPKSSAESRNEPVTADDNDFIIYAKRDGTSFINGTPIDVVIAVDGILREVSDESGIPFVHLIEAIAVAKNFVK